MMRMHKVVSSVVAAGIVLALQAPAIGQSDKAADLMAGTRKAIGGKKLEGMRSFSVQAKVQRNVGNMQIATESEFLLEMPDKYLRSDTMTGGPMNVSTAMGFNGDIPLTRVNAPGMAGGMVVRLAGPGGPMPGPNDKLTPEQQEQMTAAALRGTRQDVSRLMLGWFGMAHPTLEAEYTYAGEAESPDGRAHVIDVKGPDSFAARLFIDQETHLPLMLTYNAPRMRMTTSTMRGSGPGGAAGQGQRQGTAAQAARELTEEERERMRDEIEKMRSQAPEVVEYSLFFGDWREVDGIRFPHSIQRAVGGTTDEEWTLTKPRINPKIDPKKFQSDG
jgi:hypothetical protein